MGMIPLMIEEVSSSETSVDFYEPAEHNFPEDSRRCQNLKSDFVSHVKGRTRIEGVWKQGAW
jgi:hypothetical protein